MNKFTKFHAQGARQRVSNLDSHADLHKLMEPTHVLWTFARSANSSWDSPSLSRSRADSLSQAQPGESRSFSAHLASIILNTINLQTILYKGQYVAETVKMGGRNASTYRKLVGWTCLRAEEFLGALAPLAVVCLILVVCARGISYLLFAFFLGDQACARDERC